MDDKTKANALKAGVGTCIHCGHPIGYHHHEADKCSCKDCPCPGYEESAEANAFMRDFMSKDSN